jgi:predicted dehydrogenase
MPRALKVGVIGVGGIAGTHFPGWNASPLAEMVAFADVNPAALKRRGKEQGVKQLHERPEDLIADKGIDIVDICTPNMYHAPLAVAALKAGKHVICEKPLAPTPDDVRKMIKARDQSGKLLMTAQHFRFDGKAQALKAEVDRGALGNVYHARAWWLRRSGAPVSPGFIHKQHSGGGPCIDLGVHVLDLTLWMMSFPKPLSVAGVSQDVLAHQPGAFSPWGGAIPDDYDVEDFAAAFVRFEGGATMTLEVSWMLHHQTPGDDIQMWLYGDQGGAMWPGNELLTTCNEKRQHYNAQLQNAATHAPHAQECIAFAEAVANGGPSPVPAEQSLTVISILDGLYRSSKERREVVL